MVGWSAFNMVICQLGKQKVRIIVSIVNHLNNELPIQNSKSKLKHPQISDQLNSEMTQNTYREGGEVLQYMEETPQLDWMVC